MNTKSGKPGTISQLTAGEAGNILETSNENILHNIEEKLRANLLQRKRLENQFYLDSVDETAYERYVIVLSCTEYNKIYSYF